MLIENLSELIIILIALFYSNFARLPMMVALNILAFSYVSMSIEDTYDLSVSPGYELYYSFGSAYFFVMGLLFYQIKDGLYQAISILLVIQGIMSGAMLITDSVWWYHELLNENAIVIECSLVWLSSMRFKGGMYEQ